MLPNWCEQTVTVERAPLVQSRGTSRRDWANAKPHTVGGCQLYEGEGATTFGATERDPLEADATLHAPHGSDIADGDRITCDGRTWLVTGHPVNRGWFESLAHMEVKLKRWEG